MDYISIWPKKYVHVCDTETNVVTLHVGPLNMVLPPNKQIVLQPTKMRFIKHNENCLIENPVERDEAGNVVYTEFGLAKTRIGEKEYRTREDYPEPFPLYPGEEFKGQTPNDILKKNEAIELYVLEDYTDKATGKSYVAGQTIHFQGPAIYVPRREHFVVGKEQATSIVDNEAIVVTATRNFTSKNGVKRNAGESWMIREKGSYLREVGEKYDEVRKGLVITEKSALKLEAVSDHTDSFGIARKAGDIWLVTNDMDSEYIIESYCQKELCRVIRTQLTNRNYCKITNYHEKGVVQWGATKLVNGPTSFFLQPYELMPEGVCNIDVLEKDEALLLLAERSFTDANGLIRQPGEKWLFCGPGVYNPNVDVKTIERRKAIPLGKGEGIYVKDDQTGNIRAHIGQTYLLKAHESLWEKELSPEFEELYAIEKLGISYQPPKIVKGKLTYHKPDITGFTRVKHEVISYALPANKAVQLFDFGSKVSRVVFGPELIMLQPDEIVTVQSLSGGKPKVENCIKSLSLMLGPDFMTDQVIVETSDHAALKIELAYNWYFKYDTAIPESAENLKLFAIKDFIGNACKSISSRIRGAVSAITYDDFHHNSSNIINTAVFGRDKTTGKIREQLIFHNNNFIITSCDIKSQQPVDKDIDLKLQKNTFLAIQIKTKSTELAFQHESNYLKQQNVGELKIKEFEDLTLAEKARIEYFKIKAEKDSIESVGMALAEAKAENQKAEILGQSNVQISKLNMESQDVTANQENNEIMTRNKGQYAFENSENEIEVNEQKLMAEIEVNKIRRLLTALGSDTLATMMNAEPKMQQEMLKSLGLQGYLMTDGRNPINLFDTAQGMISQQGMNGQGPANFYNC